MSGMTIGLIMFAVLMVLLALRVHIGIGMFLVGAAGFVVMNDYAWLPLLNALKNLAYSRFSNYDLAVIPLFMLMGQFATHGGLSRALFTCVNNFVGHLRGGVAMAAVGACAALVQFVALPLQRLRLWGRSLYLNCVDITMQAHWLPVR